MNKTIPEIDRAGLRSFGLVTGAMFAGVFGVLLPWLFETSFPTWPWLIAAVLVTWAIIHPISLKYLYKPWMKLGIVIGSITTPIVLSLTYYVVVTPIGLLMRMLSTDPLARVLDPESDSYRVTSDPIESNSLERPF